MKYIIKNKILSLGAGSTVRDEAGNDLFIVKGKLLSFTREKEICTTDKKVLYIVCNRFLSLFLPKVYICDKNGNRLLMIRKRNIFSFKQNFEILPEPGQFFDLSIEGDFIGRRYDILENGIPVAHVRRNYNLIKDSFWLETDMEEKAPFYIAFVIAIDNYFDRLENDND